jgi:hypothetical protein
MAIEFRCARCGKLLRIGDDAAGRQARCPECGAISSVPAVGTPPSDLDSVSGLPPPSGQPGSPFGPRAAKPSGAPRPDQAPAESGQAQEQAYGPSALLEVPNYLVQAILCTVFCCLPFGIVSIVFAAQVNGKLAAGDYQGAVSYSRSARTWCWGSFWLGIVPLLLGFLFMFATLGVRMR